jgi:hypothetical protein
MNYRRAASPLHDAVARKVCQEDVMRRIWTLVLSSAVLSMLAIMALATSAMAALPEFLPVVSTTFKGSFGKNELQIKGSGSTKCETGKISGEITGAKIVNATIAREGCKAVGFSANTPGDATGVELFATSGEVCTLNKAAKTTGILVKVPQTVIEVPTAKQKLEIKGSLIGEVKPLNKSQTTGELVFTQKEGVQGIIKCEGGSEQFLLVKEAEKEFKQAAMEMTESFVYAKAVEVMA